MGRLLEAVAGIAALAGELGALGEGLCPGRPASAPRLLSLGFLSHCVRPPLPGSATALCFVFL